ncbi:MAG: DUF922 domain-containing protein [Mucilaginibacter sp.]
MKAGLVRMICVVVLIVGGMHTATAQSYKILTVGDFEGRPEHGGDAIAYTHCSVGFQYFARPENGYYRLDFDITLDMDKDQSWLDRSKITSGSMMNEVLNHEQGHYIIAYLEQQELLRQVSKTVFRNDYKYRAQEIFDSVHAKYTQLNHDYDADTEHSLNKVQQNSWDKYFQKRLAYMPPL